MEKLEARHLLAVFLQADFSDQGGFGDPQGFTTSGPADEWHLSTGRGNDPGHSADTSFYFGSGEDPFGNGTYGFNADGTLTSPPVDLTTATNPTLTFNHFLEVEAGEDFATVSIVTTSGTDQIAISGNQLPNSTVGFESESFDLTTYAGQVIQVEFRLISDESVLAEGWYVDDVVVSEPDPPAVGIDFSDAGGNPDAEGFTNSGPASQWHLSTGRGNDAGHSADDSFYFGSGEGPTGGGSYSTDTDGTLTSPLFDLTGAVNPRLRFNHFLEVEPTFDFATVSVISTSGTTVIATNGQELPDSTTGWESVSLDLTPFVGETVQFAFRLLSDSSATFEGWYIDDVGVENDNAQLDGLVGVDFDSSVISSPTNWTSVGSQGLPFTQSDLIDEQGNATEFDLTISGLPASSIQSFPVTPDVSTVPLHSQSLAGLDSPSACSGDM